MSGNFNGEKSRYGIVIVDSDPMVSYINREYIRHDKRFWVAGEFREGGEALAFLRDEPADLLLLELALPGYGGLALMRDMLAAKVYTNVVVATAQRDGETLREALRLGALDYLVKPYTHDRLKKALDTFADYTAASDGIRMAGQETVDFLLSIGDGAGGEKNETERRIMECFGGSRAGGGLTAKEFADALGLSIVTARRHLKRLVDAGRLTGEIDYNTGGHPRVVYHLPDGRNVPE